jgi:hypothetical protein
MNYGWSPIQLHHKYEKKKKKHLNFGEIGSMLLEDKAPIKKKFLQILCSYPILLLNFSD